MFATLVISVSIVLKYLTVELVLPLRARAKITSGHLYKPGIFCEGKEAARGKPECMGEYMRI